ncbi:energy-coupling factor transporter transmembrane component T [Latilactobacillus sakei]|uniref:energy-coupling factor transporter transmembrane component T n=1 Tax=Latilactobacillus sakei TaxID=1599 RepID=UPI00138A6348|nr:energy-coupling factor transporter transmembrane component T [Latilactobacillus sakei]
MAVYGRSRTRSPRASGLKSQLIIDQLHPLVLLVYFILMISFSMCFNHPYFLCGQLIVIIAVNWVAKNQQKTVSTLQGALLMMVLIVIMNPIINNHGTHVVMTVGGTLITAEAVVYGFLMATALAVLLLIFVTYNQHMTNHKFLALFGGIAPQLTLLTMMTMRFFPLFIRRLRDITAVQRTRGIQMATGRLKNRAQAGMHLLAILLTNTLTEALQTADSMTARGFGVQKRSTYRRYQMTHRDYGLLMALISGGLFAFWCASQGNGQLIVYPTLGTLRLTSRDWVCLSVILLIDGLPLLLEGWEYLWWQLHR